LPPVGWQPAASCYDAPAMALSCPGCGEQLPDGARFCGACGRPTEGPAAGMQVCPLCRATLPEGACFCGACGQPLTDDASDAAPSRMSFPAGMVRVPLVHHGLPPDAAAAAPRGSLPPPRRLPAPPPPGDAPVLEAEALVEEPEPAAEFEVELDEADGHFQLVEVDGLVRRGQPEEALDRLLALHGLPPGDARVLERLERLGGDLGRRAAEAALGDGSDAPALRAELKRLLRLAPHPAFRNAVRAELAPAAAAADAARVRELLAEGHLHAALTLVEKIRGLAPRLQDFRLLARDAIRAAVAEATRLQHAGDAARGRGQTEAARALYDEALELLEVDRLLLARKDGLDR
jgi:hypothetical protein